MGCIVSENIAKNKNQFSEIEESEKYLKVFKLACLLHDLGHAPFSHTGEDYYLDNGERKYLHNTIIKLTNDKDLDEEIKSKNYKAAPHELMSVIVALKDYGFLFENDEEKSFFCKMYYRVFICKKSGFKTFIFKLYNFVT